jgi:hypothetical protein
VGPGIPNLRPGREQIIGLATPAGWILPVAKASGPVEDTLDAAAQPARGLQPRAPDRLQHLHNEPDIDRLHRQVAEDRASVRVQGVDPLGLMFGVAPARLVRRDPVFTLTAVRIWTNSALSGRINPKCGSVHKDGDDGTTDGISY